MERDPIAQSFEGHRIALSAFANPASLRHMQSAAEILSACLMRGGTILVCGNGGSAADSEHFVGELVGLFARRQRRALPAISLVSNAASITAIGNDLGFEKIFSRQVEALGNSRDCLLAITTSGRSKDVVAAIAAAQKKKMRVVLLTGEGGKALAKRADCAIVVPSRDTQRIQEMHGLVIHAICAVIDEGFA